MARVLKKSVDDAAQSLRNLIAKSQEFAEQSTLLSEYLERIERILTSLPGKIPAQVEGDGVRLSFDRNFGGWGLTLELDADGEPVELSVTTASTSDKAVAAKMLPSLVDSIENQLDARIALISAGIKSIRQSPSIDALLAAEVIEDIADESTGDEGSAKNDIPF